MFCNADFAIVVPMANEEPDFNPFVENLISVLDSLKSGKVYLVVDSVSKDARFVTILETKIRNLVDAYIRGYSEAFKNDHDIIIEMDAGMSHDPSAIPMFLHELLIGS